MVNNKLYIEILKIIEDLKMKDIYEIINYDVKNDFFDLLGFEEGFSALKKIEIYKGSNINCDCDVELRSVLIYVMTFPFIGLLGLISNQRKEKREYKHKYFVKNSLNIDIKNVMNQKYYYDGMYDYIGDTMNSFTTTINEFFRNIPEEENGIYVNEKNLKSTVKLQIVMISFFKEGYLWTYKFCLWRMMSIYVIPLKPF